MAATESQLPTDPKYDQYDFPTTAPEAQPGHPGHTSPEQDAKVHQLRAELEKLGYTERLDTLTLLRFLRARKFDVEAAKTMYVPRFSPEGMNVFFIWELAESFPFRAFCFQLLSRPNGLI